EMFCVCCTLAFVFCLRIGRPARSPLFPYTTLFRSDYADLFTPDGTFGVSSEWGGGEKIWFRGREELARAAGGGPDGCRPRSGKPDRKSTRLNSSHVKISYAVFCLKKKKEPPCTRRM